MIPRYRRSSEVALLYVAEMSNRSRRDSEWIQDPEAIILLRVVEYISDTLLRYRSMAAR